MGNKTISVYQFNQNNDFNIKVHDQPYSGDKTTFLDRGDTATVTKDTTFNGQTYQAGEELPWNNPLYKHARELYLREHGPDPEHVRWDPDPPPPVETVESKPVDRNFQSIQESFRIIGADDEISEIPEGFTFTVGTKIGFYMGGNRSALIRISGPEKFVGNFQTQNPEHMATMPSPEGNYFGRVEWTFEQPGTYTFNITSSGYSKILESYFQVEVTE